MRDAFELGIPPQHSNRHVCSPCHVAGVVDKDEGERVKQVIGKALREAPWGQRKAMSPQSLGHRLINDLTGPVLLHMNIHVEQPQIEDPIPDTGGVPVQDTRETSGFINEQLRDQEVAVHHIAVP